MKKFLGYSPPFCAFLIEQFNTGRVLVLEKYIMDGAPQKRAGGAAVLQALQCETRVSILRPTPGERAAKKPGRVAALQLSTVWRHLEAQHSIPRRAAFNSAGFAPRILQQ